MPETKGNVYGEIREPNYLSIHEGQSVGPRPPSSQQLARAQWLCLLFLCIAVALYGLYSTRAISFPIVLSFLIALPLRPLVRIIRRAGLPDAIGATLIISLLIALVVFANMLLWEPARKWISSAPQNLRQVEEKLRALRGPFAKLAEAGESVEQLTESDRNPVALQVEVKQPKLTSMLLTTTGNLLVGATITLSLVFLLLAFGDQLLRGVARILPERVDRDKMFRITYAAERTISRYLLTYTMINIGLGMVIGGGLWLIGMPNPVLWGAMATCLNYIPFVGLGVGTAVVFVVAAISFDSMSYALLAPAIYLGANGIEANIVTPLLLGKSLRLNVILIFLAIVIWGWMWGIGGALIAVPLLIVLKAIFDHVQRLKPAALFLEA